MKHGIRKHSFPGALELMVLQLLKAQRLHGYALVQAIKRSSRDLLQIEEGSLYPALQRMLKQGRVKARWTTSTEWSSHPAGPDHAGRGAASRR